MESSGFVRTRFRNKKAKKNTAADEGGCYRFRDLRWLDPDVPSERNHLLTNWSILARILQPAMTFDAFCMIVRSAICLDAAYVAIGRNGSSSTSSSCASPSASSSPENAFGLAEASTILTGTKAQPPKRKAQNASAAVKTGRKAAASSLVLQYDRPSDTELAVEAAHSNASAGCNATGSRVQEVLASRPPCYTPASSAKADTSQWKTSLASCSEDWQFLFAPATAAATTFDHAAVLAHSWESEFALPLVDLEVAPDLDDAA
eukprot:3801546-Rhodomonas_salina.1